MSSKWVRQFHRWVAIAFTLAAIANLAAQGGEQAPIWLALLAVVPLILLLITGLYMFVLPYAVKWRRTEAPE